jgi:hypothetical protein
VPGCGEEHLSQLAVFQVSLESLYQILEGLWRRRRYIAASRRTMRLAEVLGYFVIHVRLLASEIRQKI